MSPVWSGFWFLFFPGLVFTAFMGMLASFLDRKLTARIQSRVGPPWFQPAYDLYKLFHKDTIIPISASRLLFILAPFLGLAGVTICASLLGVSVIWSEHSFIGDLFVLYYFLMFPTLAVLLGGLSSRNPVAALGVAREIKLFFAYELVFLISLAVVLVKTNGELRLSQILFWQTQNRALVFYPSGALAFFLALLTTQAKLTAVPFDLPEAETEISSGVLIEYSGALLGIYQLTQMMMLFVMPCLLSILFLGKLSLEPLSLALFFLKYFILLLGFIFLRNLNPRLRMDQTLKFFWYPMTFLGIIALILAFYGW